MSNVTLWARPTWEIDRWVKKKNRKRRNQISTENFSPAAEVVRDGDDAVVRPRVPGVDVAKDVNVEVDKGQLVIRGERRDEHIGEDPCVGRSDAQRGPLRVVPAVVQAADTRHQRRDLGVV